MRVTPDFDQRTLAVKRAAVVYAYRVDPPTFR